MGGVKTFPRRGARSYDPDATMEFLNDIKNYIPLGSLTASRIRVPGGSDPPLLEWKEASETAWFWHHTLADWYALITFGWIRVFVRKHQEYDDMLTLRIFILPDDVGRRYLDRSDDFTRKNLIRLMEIVDFSLDSWEGRNGTVHLLERPDTDAINDDSLFYLFNTLPAPSSTVLGVSCKISKGAMQSLTDERTSLLGLKTKLYPYQQRSAATMIRREVEPALTLDPRLELFEGATGQKFYYDKATGVLLREKRAYEESRGGILAEVWNSVMQNVLWANFHVILKDNGFRKNPDLLSDNSCHEGTLAPDTA